METKEQEYKRIRLALEAMTDRELTITMVFYLKDIKDRLDQVLTAIYKSKII